MFADELVRFTRAPVPPFRDWLEAIPYLFRVTRDHPIPVVSEAARFRGITDPALAVLVHSIVGGTPAYRREFVRDDTPDGADDFGEPDFFPPGRATYRIAEPLVTFYQAIMSHDWARLELGDAAVIWRNAQPRFARISGPTRG